jgi:1-acyl-sn-glycerol-3-phosphate acyltransferase
MRTFLVIVTLLVNTNLLGALVIVASYFGVRYRPGNIMAKAPRWWAKSLLRAGGVKVVLHDAHRANPENPHVFVSNHVSWFDVLALAAELPRYNFVAKAEIFRVPVFGRGAKAVGTIPIQRENRKAAFAAYEEAARRIRNGDSVVVFPEGTRGTTYALRPFKKGPFVLAIAAGVPVIPTVIHGTIEVNPRGTLRARSGRVDVHLLAPVSTAGLSYEERDALSRAVYERMAEGFRQLYGIDSPPYPTSPAAAVAPAGAD